MGPGEAWKEAHAQALGLSWAGLGGLENGPGLNAADLQTYYYPQVCLALGPPRSPLVARTTASDRLKKGPGPSSPARPGLPLAWSRGNGAAPPWPGNNKPALSTLLSCNRLSGHGNMHSRFSATCTHTAGKTHIYVVARLDPDGR